MKITKEKLKKIINEELEGFEKVKTTQVRRDTAKDVKQKVAGGITDDERGMIQKLQGQLAQAAQTGNIASGAVLRWATRLSAELEKFNPRQRQFPLTQTHRLMKQKSPLSPTLRN